ncbi:speedy protein 1-A-like [Mixophyes fleayi]|uniref:speedy protein 1-A-like n=1 Tax=Mixophyes fleayi TaxID=3061075 RepID=UPI003F4DF770
MERRTTEDNLNPAKRRKLQGDQSQPCTADHSPSLGQAEKAAFYKLLEEPTIYSFLTMDSCVRMSDKYLLAMVLVYFRRASLSETEYTCVNFYSALLLANKTEEEELWYRTIYSYAARLIPLKMFLQNTDALWNRMQLQTRVTLEQCEEVMRAEDHWAWQRKRKDHHGEAIRKYARKPCQLCNPPQPFKFPFAYYRVTPYYKNISKYFRNPNQK